MSVKKYKLFMYHCFLKKNKNVSLLFRIGYNYFFFIFCKKKKLFSLLLCFFKFPYSYFCILPKKKRTRHADMIKYSYD